jgi:eukaryotic-like serine/threonine-protein kinase
MSDESNKPVREIFANALELKDPLERERYLAQACGPDAKLRQMVEALLLAHQEAGGFLQPTRVVPPEQVIGEGPGTVIGRYKLLQEIGQGGFGVVFMAKQLEPVQRKVALKIIKPGMDTKEVIARFEAERQALAMMDHPNIARVLDAGATESGRPYFVMELVKGIRITDYCDQNDLPTEERLKLFMKVCHAVQHAHQKGIIHRDLKPSNVMVTLHDGDAVPKVIDFGIAKATGQPLTDKTLFTRYEQMIGTPAYMSPEQAAMSGLDVDTRTDIYALGVLLYELLIGVTPFDKETLAKAALDEVRRLIRETEPPKPSTRLHGLGDKQTEVAKHRHTEPAGLTRQVHGDLDWIVMKCLEKDRARRYETANMLLADIQHHLDHEPVKAGPPGAAYRTRKFIRRHRAGVAVATALTLVLAVGLTAALIGFARARRERDRAEHLVSEEARQRELADANYQTARQAVDRMLSRATNDLEGQPRMTPVHRKLLEDVLEFDQRFLKQKGNDPELQHRVAQTYLRVGGIYAWLGQYAKSLEPRRKALALLEGLAQRHPEKVQYREELAGALNALAGSCMWLDRAGEYVAHAQKMLTLCEALRSEFPAEPRYLRLLVQAHAGVGIGLGHLGQHQESLLEHQQAQKLYEDYRNRFPDLADNPSLAAWLSHWLGSALNRTGRTEEAEREYRKAHELYTQLAAQHPDDAGWKGQLAHISTYLGEMLSKTGQLDEAEKLLRQATVIVEKLLEGSPESIEWRRLGDDYKSLAKVLLALHRTPEAEAAIRRSIELHTKAARIAPGAPLFRGALAWSTYDLGEVLLAAGRQREADEAFGNAIAILEKVVAENPGVLKYERYLGLMLVYCPALQFRDAPRAVALAKDAVQRSPRTPAYWNLLGAAQYQAGDFTAAIEALQKTFELLGSEDGDIRLHLAMAYWQKGDRGQAREWHRKAVEWIEKNHPADPELDRLRVEAAALLGKDPAK